MWYLSPQRTKHFRKSFVSSNLEALSDPTDPDTVDLEDIQGATAQIFATGTDTVSCFLEGGKHSYLLNVCSEELCCSSSLRLGYTPVSRLSETSLRRDFLVVGHDRLPNLDDRESLPYLECVLQEVFRYAIQISSSISFVELHC